MSTALQAYNNNSEMDSWTVIREQCVMLVKTGFLPQSIKTAEQAIAIVMTGRELGIGPMAALQTINIIQNKPTVSPQLMLALINRSGQADDIQISATNEGATVTMKRKGRTSYTANFGPKEAMALGLHSKDNYKKQPATMYKWRAVADAARVVFPDVVLGLFAPDEMGADVDMETGEVIEMPVARPHLAPAASEAPVDTQVPLETNPNKIALEMQAPVKSQARIKLDALIAEIHKSGIGFPEIQFQVERVTGKRERSKLTDEECELAAAELDDWLEKINSEDVDQLF